MLIRRKTKLPQREVIEKAVEYYKDKYDKTLEFETRVSFMKRRKFNWFIFLSGFLYIFLGAIVYLIYYRRNRDRRLTIGVEEQYGWTIVTRVGNDAKCDFDEFNDIIHGVDVEILAV